ncbi:MAG TPA: DNA polymerase III subunit alpha [Kurthia sp.]
MLTIQTSENLQNWFEDHPDWLLHTEELLTSCEVELTFNTHYMPKFPVQDGKTAQQLLLEQCKAGLEQRGLNGIEHYENRLNYELSIINQMGYADYFLIVADYIEYARSQRILTGPGRGSSASSLVAYSLKITNVDPIKYDLLFERFLNPDRITLPDIDVDFADLKRQQVIDYVVEKYGMQYTSQIITFGTLSAKAVARDVARVLGFTMDDLKVISSLIPSKPGTTLSMILPTLKKWIGEDPIKEKWLEIALKLEGLHRNASTHAAGVVLSPIPLPEIVPIEKGSDQIYITQWPMQEVEETGLLKMDFLGLKNLSILDHIRYLIYFNQKKMLDFEKIPLHDENTFRLLQRGDTAGVFQLESEGMRKALIQIQPTSFLDVVAINALYRPGPMEFIPVYSRRKHGMESVQLPHPDLAPILDETFGVIVYQEQIMRIASVFAGFSLGEADLLRRAVSKKKRELLDSERVHFVKGAINKGYNEQVANEIYDLIVRFANYGFPKSHAVAYSLITYQMAYLKANFPHYFYAALLSSAIGNKEKHSQLLQEVRSKGIEIFPPSILKSGKSYRVEGNGIRFALGAVRGIPQTFLNKLQALRKNEQAEWTSIFEMALSFTSTHFKRQTIEALIKAGALDVFERDRAQLIETIPAAEKLAKLYAPNEETTLFYDTNIYGVPKHAAVENMTEKEKLEGEKEVLGFYVSKHPVENLKEKNQFNGQSLNRVSSIKIGAKINVLAQVQNMKVIRTKKGEQMAFLQLEDETSSISATIFPQVFEKYKEDFIEDQFLAIEAKVESRNNAPQLIIQLVKVIPKE